MIRTHVELHETRTFLTLYRLSYSATAILEEKPIEFTLPEFSVERGGAGMSLKDDPGELLHGCSQALSGPLSSLGSSELSLPLKIRVNLATRNRLTVLAIY